MKKIKIAVPSNDGQTIFHGMLGRAARFSIYELDREKRKITFLEVRPNPYEKTLQHEKTRDVYTLMDDCSMILSEKIGRQGRQWLRKRNVHLIFANGDILTALQKAIKDV